MYFENHIDVRWNGDGVREDGIGEDGVERETEQNRERIKKKKHAVNHDADKANDQIDKQQASHSLPTTDKQGSN